MSIEQRIHDNANYGPEDIDDECPYCGGEGFTFDCIDGSCEDCDIGCDDCTRPCSHCGIKTKPLPEGLGDVLSDALHKNGEQS